MLCNVALLSKQWVQDVLLTLFWQLTQYWQCVSKHLQIKYLQNQSSRYLKFNSCFSSWFSWTTLHWNPQGSDILHRKNSNNSRTLTLLYPALLLELLLWMKYGVWCYWPAVPNKTQQLHSSASNENWPMIQPKGARDQLLTSSGT